MDRTRAPESAPDRGQVVPLVAGLLVLLGATAMLLGLVAGVLVDRGRAQTAADAAALAAAAGTDRDAAALAAANGAELVAVHRDGAEVEVTVRIGRVRARARAVAALVLRPPPAADERSRG
jgi:hypothetical protein